ncbi:MFS transporter [Quadrisphaera sp. INWT6]|uniref:MFS transporter n=1 Tax=Quadrisphaera sp. INWT6 TaxID=2596917 RepID=UPI001892055D|nr:MFS transporter [Quadrisphaera sp. INWT6]
MVYEGARSITGPLLGTLGASALVVGLVVGAGEAAALLLRLAFGPLADRTRRYWSLTLLGYTLTAVCVPLLALTPFLGAAGLGVAAALILAERAGKAVRSPAKSALLAQAATGTGLGRGFAVHKALDQVGAFSGPLLVAGLIAATGVVWPALALLALPGAAAIVVLVVVRRRMPALDLDPAKAPASSSAGDAHRADTPPAAPRAPTASRPARGIRGWLGLDLPGRFFLFAAAAAAATAGLATFGMISYHATRTGLLTLSSVPLVYAAAMAAAAVSALASGWLFDRWHARVLLALPLLGAAVPALAFSTSAGALVAGALLWGAAGGVQDSTVKALVADLVPAGRRASAYGVFAAIQGAAALAGGALAGLLYERSLVVLVICLAACQVLALALLIVQLRMRRRQAAAPASLSQ